MLIACLLGVAFLSSHANLGAQTPAGQKPVMAEDVLKNIQVLRGIPLDEFMGTMGFISAATSLNCTDCHVPEALTDWDRYKDDTPLKQTTRKMIVMVNALNQTNFGGKREVTCYTCHRGSTLHPKITPSLEQQYGVVPDVEANEVEVVAKPLPNAPTVDQILDKYIQATGGAQRLGTLNSFIAKGTYSGFDTADREVPVEVYAKVPSQRTTIAHVPVGNGSSKDSTTAFDGRAGWISTPNTFVPMLEMTGGNVDGAKVDADLSFPGRIKQALTNWSSNLPETKIDERDVRVLQGMAGKTLVKLYFDKESGLLVRQVRFVDTKIGFNPTQVDYSDYRDTGGIKLPYHWVLSWTDGMSTFQMKEVQVNAPIDAAKFGKPKG
jgi:hypothetical protein